MKPLALAVVSGVLFAISACGGAPSADAPGATTVETEDDHDHGEHDDHSDDHDEDAAHSADAEHDQDEHGKHDEDEHDDHDDHAHDHDNEDGIDLSAHAHGAADLAVVLEGETLSISLDSPLANFGVSEGGAEMDQVEGMYKAAPMPSSAFTPTAAAGCDVTEEERNIIRSGDHGRFEWQISYTCAAPENLTGITVDLFKMKGFERIDAVMIGENGETAKTLTAKSTDLNAPK